MRAHFFACENPCAKLIALVPILVCSQSDPNFSGFKILWLK